METEVKYRDIIKDVREYFEGKNSIGKLTNHKCAVGCIGENLIEEDVWVEAVKKFEEKVNFFEHSRRATPHPGFIGKFKYCPECGKKL